MLGFELEPGVGHTGRVVANEEAVAAEDVAGEMRSLNFSLS